MTDTPLLLGCPFCGSKARYDDTALLDGVFIECSKPTCWAQGPVRATKGRAIAAWNRRAPIEKRKGKA